MQIPETLIEKWTALRSEDDTAKIADNAKTDPEKIRRAFRDKKCSDEIFKAMADYYEQKSELIKQYL